MVGVLKKPIKKVAKAIATMFRTKVRTRHPSHSVLRSKLPMLPFPSVIRLGSTTSVPDLVTKSGKVIKRIEINSPESIQNSASKFKMKDCFKRGEVKTAEFWTVKEVNLALENWEVFPLVAKINFGSRGRGMVKIDKIEQLRAFLKTKDLAGYYFEKFYNYNREYRIHISEDGYFYTCRKMVKSDTPEDKKWFRNDSNSVWIMENNENFDKPSNWSTIVAECVKALRAVGLDVGACDVRVQSATDGKGNKRTEVDFIIVEINSAPSFGDVTAEKYLEEIPKILKRKHGLQHQL